MRLNRKRFWGKDMSDDKRSAYDTLYTCLMTMAHLLAPFAPFVSDELYHDLGGQLESIHLDRWPKADEARIDADLEARMDMAQKITSMVLALRRKVNIKVRQPLAQIMVPAIDEEQRRHIEAVAALIKSEVNVKELNFVEGEGLLVKKVKCNFRVMGKKFGKLMKGVAAKMNTLSQAEIAQLEREGSIGFEVEGQPISVDATDVEIISEDMPGWLVNNEGNLTVALEVELTDDLRREGMARELINRIQNLRKESGLEITDRIVVSIDPHKETDEALETSATWYASRSSPTRSSSSPRAGTRSTSATSRPILQSRRHKRPFSLYKMEAIKRRYTRRGTGRVPRHCPRPPRDGQGRLC